MVRALIGDGNKRVAEAWSPNVVDSYSRRLWSWATAPPHKEEWVEVAQASGQDASWMSYSGVVQVHPIGIKSRDWHKTSWRMYLALEYLGIPLK